MKRTIGAATLLLVLSMSQLVSAGSDLENHIVDEAVKRYKSDNVEGMQAVLKENGLYNGPANGQVNEELLSSLHSYLDGINYFYLLNSHEDLIVYDAVMALNNKYEYKLAQKGQTKNLNIIGNVPAGGLSSTSEEDGVKQTIRWDFRPDGSCTFTEIYEDLSDPNGTEKESISGRCQLVQWINKSYRTLFFFPETVSSDQSEYLMYLYSLKSRGLIAGMSYKVDGETIIIGGNPLQKAK